MHLCTYLTFKYILDYFFTIKYNKFYDNYFAHRFYKTKSMINIDATFKKEKSDAKTSLLQKLLLYL